MELVSQGQVRSNSGAKLQVQSGVTYCTLLPLLLHLLYLLQGISLNLN